MDGIKVYVLINAYSDKSGFCVCGVTQSEEVMSAWTKASDQTSSVKCDLDGAIARHDVGFAEER